VNAPFAPLRILSFWLILVRRMPIK